MISDVLHEAILRIDEYIDDPLFNPVYSGFTRRQILALRESMQVMMDELDTCPNPSTKIVPLWVHTGQKGAATAKSS